MHVSVLCSGVTFAISLSLGHSKCKFSFPSYHCSQKHADWRVGIINYSQLKMSAKIDEIYEFLGFTVNSKTSTCFCEVSMHNLAKCSTTLISTL